MTDTGQVHDERHLKGRGEGATRVVPAHPAFVAILRDLTENYGLRGDDILFQGERGGLLTGSVYRRVWAKARKTVLPETEYDSPTGKRVYDLRHTCLTTWLNNGVPQRRSPAWIPAPSTTFSTAAASPMHGGGAGEPTTCVHVCVRRVLPGGSYSGQTTSGSGRSRWIAPRSHDDAGHGRPQLGRVLDPAAGAPAVELLALPAAEPVHGVAVLVGGVDGDDRL